MFDSAKKRKREDFPDANKRSGEKKGVLNY
jgi:hypothetical protein